MRELYEKIQSPSALFAFEAAARLRSFTLAAKELNVSQPAISLSVKKIETALGIKLFERQHRAIALTELGERFYADVSFGLMHILRSAEAIGVQTAANHVTLSCSTAFAHYWLVPKLGRFKTMYPDIDIRMQTTDRDIDLRKEGIALGIRRGTGDWDEYDAHLLSPERIYPVCSPSYLAEIESPKNAADLLAHDLIHLEEPFRLRPKWGDWFETQGVRFRDSGGGLRLNDYALVIQAAIAGEGIAFGWHHIVQPLIKSQLLTKPVAGEYDIGQGFYLVWARNSELNPQAAKFLEWLKSEAQ